MGCDHDKIVPTSDDGCEGRCADCGAEGFVICDPHWDVHQLCEVLANYPSDEARAEFMKLLREVVSDEGFMDEAYDSGPDDIRVVDLIGIDPTSLRKLVEERDQLRRQLTSVQRRCSDLVKDLRAVRGQTE